MKAYYQGKTQELNESVNTELRNTERAGGLPIHEDRKSSVSRGSDVAVMED